MECYNNLPMNYSCLPTCTGLYADVNPRSGSQYKPTYMDLMEKEYNEYKATYGEYIPFIYKSISKANFIAFIQL